MNKKLMNNYQEKEYHQLIFDCIREAPEKQLKHLHIEIQKNLDIKFSISKLSKDFAALNIKRIKEDGRWIYKYIKPSVVDEFPIEFKNYIEQKPTTHSSNLSALKIKVILGSESIVCITILDKYGNKNIICIPAYSSVCILSSDLIKLRKIKKDLCALFKK